MFNATDSPYFVTAVKHHPAVHARSLAYKGQMSTMVKDHRDMGSLFENLKDAGWSEITAYPWGSWPADSDPELAAARSALTKAELRAIADILEHNMITSEKDSPFQRRYAKRIDSILMKLRHGALEDR